MIGLIVLGIIRAPLICAAETKAPVDVEAVDVGATNLEKSQVQKAKEERLKWWREARFGCFVHWGPYSQLGNLWRGQKGGYYAEHIQRVLKIPMRDYKADAVDKFNPVKFNADAWIALVKKTGMKYFIITAKHHDGYAMYDSKVSDYNIVKQSPWKHDPMNDLKAACAREGIRFGFYYSHAFDWGEEFAPGNDWEWKNPGGDSQIGGRNWYDHDPEKLKSVREKYVNRKSIPQIQELIANYKPDIFWFDTPNKLPVSENQRILAAVRQASPGIVINGRLVYGEGDYANTGDRAVEFQKLDSDWEAIPTTNESYGWNPLDHSYKTPEFMIRVLAKAVSRGGNILLNIGPTRDGEIDPHDVAILEGIGAWMSLFEESIHGANASPLPPQSWGVITSKAKSLYLHVFDWPQKPLIVGGLRTNPTSAHLITAKGPVPLKWKRLNDLDIAVSLPAKATHASDSVIRLTFGALPQGGGVRLVNGAAATNQLLVFDAERYQGDKKGNDSGLDYGDGKQNNYCLMNWISPEQWISWEVRVEKQTVFDVALNYGKAKGGDYVVQCGNWKSGKSTAFLEGDLPRIPPPQVDQLGSLSLAPGIHRIELRVTKSNGKEVFRPLELWLTPQKK